MMIPDIERLEAMKKAHNDPAFLSWEKSIMKERELEVKRQGKRKAKQQAPHAGYILSEAEGQEARRDE